MEVTNINRPYLDEFIQKVFYYYNGKINLHMEAKLKIEWCYNYNDNSVVGNTYLPNIVEIYPMNVIKFIHDNTSTDDKYMSAFIFRLRIIETIIHELHHIDQYINQYKIQTSPTYETRIEHPVEFMTYSYMITHIQEILMLADTPNNKMWHDFAYNCIREVFSYIDECIHGYGPYYKRKTYKDHIFISVCSFMGTQPVKDLIDTFRTDLYDHDNDIALLFENEDGGVMYLRRYGNLIDHKVFNKFVSDYILTEGCWGIGKVLCKYTDDGTLALCFLDVKKFNIFFKNATK